MNSTISLAFIRTAFFKCIWWKHLSDNIQNVDLLVKMQTSWYKTKLVALDGFSQQRTIFICKMSVNQNIMF